MVPTDETDAPTRYPSHNSRLNSAASSEASRRRASQCSHGWDSRVGSLDTESAATSLSNVVRVSERFGAVRLSVELAIMVAHLMEATGSNHRSRSN